MQYIYIDEMDFTDNSVDYYYYAPKLDLHSLLLGYFNGFFPWYEKGELIRYYCPAHRAILIPNQFHCSRSLSRSVQKMGFSCAIDTDFEQIIMRCATCHTQHNGNTWITDELRKAFCALNTLGVAHSIAIYSHGKLCGGLYGLALGSVFCGESMFHTVTNASKIALLILCHISLHRNITFIDCQMPTSHLQSLGATTISRVDFLHRLRDSLHSSTQVGLWHHSVTQKCSIDTEDLLSMV